MRRISLLALPALLCACDVNIHRGQADTVARVDTVVRVDTVLVARDSLVGLDSADVAPPIPAVPPPSPGDVRTDTAAPPAASASAPAPAPSAPASASDDEALRARALRVPVQGVAAAQLRDNFAERRGGGRAHEALDIMAPRGTPVLSADDGRVAKLFTSKPGGLTVYVASPDGRFMYYYAHLDRYRDGLAEGAAVRKGDLLGYVGSTGDASPDAPHLHFAIARVADPKRWWAGTPIDPYPFLAPSPSR